MIEVEVRGPITNADHARIAAFLDEKGASKKVQDRIFIDYSEPMETRTKDVRIRCTNGVSEIMIKLGKTGGTDSRREFGSKVGENKFDELVGVMHALGYDKGPLCHFKSDIYKYGEFEIVLKAVPGHDNRGMFEAEIEVASESEVPQAQEKIEALLAELGVRKFDDAEFHKHVDGLNTIFPLFDYASYEQGYFAKTYGI